MALLYIFASGLAIGFAGNLHCVGMCGPLALSFSPSIANQKSPLLSSIIYHSSRIISYLFIGLIMGLLGKGLSLVIVQQWISLLSGTILLIYISIFYTKINLWLDKTPLFSSVKTGIASILNKPLDVKDIARLGLLNGLLPCGLVYMTSVLAISSGNIINSLTLMLGFGIATLPSMFAMMYFGTKLNFKNRMLLKKASPFITFSIAILLILRGLNLGIPYVSPKLESDKMSCCERAK